ncbi:SDR family oxidoreductase [Saccharopolyspora indica]|uniref:SDR family NAD(P)-dependent oxidoreductase n=1 Tax=Saccharopolyspora indica TaxID=1229659 RepID=UPI0022EAC9C1|nr:SDR family oxidoreductase [Saccharopolyspora indica]MDA3647661.1 SDR family oxidoreductase [Saccharopolyspora indica]
MDYELQGKCVLVTGGTRGIGRATSLAFAGAGATVLACYRSDDAAAEALARELDAVGFGHRVVRADVTDPAAVADLVDECRRAFGGLDVVVNNAGADGRSPAAQLTPAQWHRVVDANLTSAFLVTSAAAAILRPGGSVVTIGGAVATRGRPGMVHHNAAKAGVLGLTRSLARELGPRAIRVNAVAPGVIEPAPGGGMPPGLREQLAGLTALGRLGTPGDIADVVLFLASAPAGYLTGVSITADGGI